MICSVVTVAIDVMMVKYTPAILLIAAISFWAPASAKPRHNAVQDEEIKELVDEFYEIDSGSQDVPRSLSSSEESQPWHEDIDEGIFRKKRQPDFLTDEQLQEIKKGTRIDYADVLLMIAPKAHVETLRRKLYKAAEKKYADFDDYEKEADGIYEEVTGINFDKLVGRKTK